MTRTRYLVDTSVFARLVKPAVAAAFAQLAAEGQVAGCPPVAFELGYPARTTMTTRRWQNAFSPFQPFLAERGQHRAMSLVDGLVAAVAEARSLTVLHYDADFELVVEITGQPHQWVVDRGAAD